MDKLILGKNLLHQIIFFNSLKNRPYWRSYYPSTNAVIYVIDSTDRDRLEISK